MVVLNKVSDTNFIDLVLFVKSQIKRITSSCFSKRIIEIELLDLCAECKNMASVPHGAFAACKMRNTNENENILAKVRVSSEMPDMRNNVANKKLLEYSPVKYNSKLMNSIWGLYNRYSPHNIKGNEYEVEGKTFNKQQS